jgi:hypothetical protein
MSHNAAVHEGKFYTFFHNGRAMTANDNKSWPPRPTRVYLNWLQQKNMTSRQVETPFDVGSEGFSEKHDF